MDNVDNMHLFFPTSDKIELFNKIIVCQKQIKKSWIDMSLDKKSFGYAHMLPKANKDTDEYYMHGFILCRIDSESPHIGWIDFICSRPNSKVGKLLFAEEHIKENKNIKLIQLMSLPEPKLQTWYKKLGFSVSSIDIWDGVPKAFLMTKLLF